MATQIAPLKQWQFPEQVDVDETLLKAADGSKILAQLLVRRGVNTAGDIRAFLDPAEYTPTPAHELLGMERAVARVKQALAAKEKITIYGDYDVDGVTATSVMVTTLRRLGADVDFYVPTRSEGYGLNLKAVSVLASKHRTKLIITCDCGISNFSEVNFARSLGVDTIIVDHHTMPELLPPAAAILHPKQLAEEHPLFHLPGVGVAYKFSEALLDDAGLSQEIPLLLDFVTLGMIADMVPLTKECRYLVQVGMPVLVGSQRAGIRALLSQVASKSDGTDLVGFGLAPRINAVGRLADANLAVQLMITEEEDEAKKLAHQLEVENLRRQELCEQIFASADQVAHAKLRNGDRALAIYSAGWHHGVVGIVASRLVEKYHCPVFIGELDTEEAIVKGSARGIPGIDLYEILKENEQLALKWGGHKMAAGFSVEAGKADLFCKSIVESCNRKLADVPPNPVLSIDLVVPAEQVTMELAECIARLAPFGIANKKPVLVLEHTECVGTRVLGRDGKHHRISIGCDAGDQFECVYWNSRGRIPYDGQVVDIAFTPELNTYNGNTRLQLVLNDWRDPSQPAPVMDFTPPAVAEAAAMQAGVVRQAAQPPGTSQQAVPAPPVAPVERPVIERPTAQEAPGAVATPIAAPSAALTFPARPINWKDLRAHSDPESLIHAAVRKLGGNVAIYAESSMKIANVQFKDRLSLQDSQHLMIWYYPPSEQIFKSLLQRSNAQHVYVVGGAPFEAEDANSHLKKLLGLIRYAVNQRDGQAEAEKVAAALGTTKMCVALGLAILKKIGVVDWFAEDGLVYLDLLGQPTEKPEQVAEFRQLAQCLKDVFEFRQWCQSAGMNEIQLAFAPAKSASAPLAINSVREGEPEDTFSGIQHNDTANQLSSPY